MILDPQILIWLCINNDKVYNSFPQFYYFLFFFAGKLVENVPFPFRLSFANKNMYIVKEKIFLTIIFL